jgi:hypothetical protein
MLTTATGIPRLLTIGTSILSSLLTQNMHIDNTPTSLTT